MNGSQLQNMQALVIAAGVVALAGLFLLSALSIRYHLTDTHLKVTWLGLPVRRLRLEDIKRVGARPVLWAERWPNSWDRGRLLVVRRRTGWVRNFVITPEHPFEFRRRLEQACRARLGLPLEETEVITASEIASRPPAENPRQTPPPGAR